MFKALRSLKKQKALIVVALAPIILLYLSPSLAQASSTSGNLPWDGPLETIKNDLSGPVALAISLLGIVVSGAALIWGGEISDFVRRIIMVVLVIALLVSANSLLTTLFGSGAVIAVSSERVSFTHVDLS